MPGARREWAQPPALRAGLGQGWWRVVRGPGRSSAGRGDLGARGAAAVPRLWPATPGPLSEAFHCRSGPSVPVRPAALFSLFVSAALSCSYRPSTGRVASPPAGGALGVPQSQGWGTRRPSERGGRAARDGAHGSSPCTPSLYPFSSPLSLSLPLPCTPSCPSLRPPWPPSFPVPGPPTWRLPLPPLVLGEA